MGRDELDDVYRRYAYLVYRRCRFLLENDSQAQEASQEVFVRAFRNIARSADCTLAWLYLTANHYCFDLARRRRREQRAVAQWPQQESTVDTAEDVHRRALFQWAFDRMERQEVQIVMLHHLDGLTQDEVAAQTGYSRRTVGKKLKMFQELILSHERELAS